MRPLRYSEDTGILIFDEGIKSLKKVSPTAKLTLCTIRYMGPEETGLLLNLNRCVKSKDAKSRQKSRMYRRLEVILVMVTATVAIEHSCDT